MNTDRYIAGMNDAARLTIGQIEEKAQRLRDAGGDQDYIAGMTAASNLTIGQIEDRIERLRNR
jgi:hypothetical protein